MANKMLKRTVRMFAAAKKPPKAEKLKQHNQVRVYKPDAKAHVIIRESRSA